MAERRGVLFQKNIRAVIAVIAILTLLPVLSGCSSGAEKIRMGTAGIGGNYYTFGKTFAQFLMGDIKGTDVQVKVTAGSGENLSLMTLQEPELELAVIQADVLSEMEELSEDQSGVGAIAGLYAEAVQVIVRQGEGIKSIADLKGKSVSIGQTNSGTERNAKLVLSAYGIADGMYKARNLKYTEASQALQEGTIDAFFCTMGAPTAVISSLANKTPVTFLEISGREAASIIDAYPYYISYTIPAGTYAGQDTDIHTVGVKAVLVASHTLSDDMVTKITESFFKNAQELQYAVSVGFNPDPVEAVKDLPIALHEGARAWYEKNGIAVSD